MPRYALFDGRYGAAMLFFVLRRYSDAAIAL